MSTLNQTVQNMIERRSIRKYKADPVNYDDLNMIVKAGTYAASGMGKQSSKIIVVRNKAVRDKLSQMNAAIMGIDSDPFYGAPIVIVVLADKTVPTHECDGSLVIGNMMIAAHSIGLGSCWIHRAKEEFDSEEGKALLRQWGISENYVGIGHCIVGYADGEYPEAKARKEDYVQYVE